MKKLYFSIFYFVSCSLFLTAQVEQKKEASQDIINFNNRVGNKNIINEIDILLDENYPQYNISDILKTGLNGIAIELNKKYEIKGYIYSDNLTTQKYSVYIMDKDTNGILIEKDATVFPNFKIGDEIVVRGIVSQFNGRINIQVDTFFKTGIINNLIKPRIVKVLDESTESKLVKIEKVHIKDVNQWVQNSTSPFKVTVSNNIRLFDILISEKSTLSKLPVPFGEFDIIGFGSQDDDSLPYFENYILVPRSADDLIPRKIYESLTIKECRENDIYGKPYNLNSNVKISGIVSSPNFIAGKKLEFLLTNEDGEGIMIYNSTTNFNYNATEKQQITVWGTLKQLSGLTVVSIDTLFLDQNIIDYKSPQTIIELNEGYENTLVTWNNAVKIVNEQEWVKKSPFFDVQVTDGTSSFVMRIKENTDIFNLSNPINKTFKLSGVEIQNSNKLPYNTDYIIQPRYMGDLEIANTLIDLNEQKKLAYPNPVENSLNLMDYHHTSQNIQLTDNEGKTIMDIDQNKLNIDFSNLPSGTYFLKTNHIAESFVQKIVKY